MEPATSVSKALRQAAADLQQAGVGEPRLTAEVLLMAVLRCDRAFLFAHGSDGLTPDQSAEYQAKLEVRYSGTPTQYITGVQEFYGLLFRVTPDVLIPRPETELLVEQAIARADAGDSILDIGTGSGAIAVVIQKHLPEAKVFASDISRAALTVAAENAARLTAEVRLVQGDLAETFRPGSLDMVVSNPPYVPAADRSSLQREVRDHEPAQALFGGADGLEAYRRLSATGHGLLRSGGWLLMEVGYNTSAAVKSMFDAPCWQKPHVYRDLAGWERVLAVQRAAPVAGRKGEA